MALCITLPVLAAPAARAWSNGGYSSDPTNPDYGTHDWIADQALGIQTRDVTFLSTTYHSRYLLGTEAPDNPAYIGDSTKHHVYYYANELLQDDASALRASQLYQIALGYLRTGNLEAAAYDIGAMTHYVSDVGVFGHTMGSATDWGTETHHSDYESKIESMTGSLEPPTGLILGNESAYNATIGLAYDITFGEEGIRTNVWMDTNYDWTDPVFMASSMASLYDSLSASAAVINHLMIEAGLSGPPTPPQEPPSTSPAPFSVPQPPASLTVTFVDSSVFLTWSYPASDGGSPVSGYAIFRGTSLNNRSLLASVAAGTQSWNDVTPEKGRQYYYWVAAVNSVGMSDMSQVAFVKVPRDPGLPDLAIAIPVILSAAVASIGAILWRMRGRGKA